MPSRKLKATLNVILFGAVLGATIHPAAGQDLKGYSRPRTVTRGESLNLVPEGQSAVITGNIIKVEGDTFSVCDMKGAETVVVLSDSTKITTHRRGTFRPAAAADKNALLVGLRVQVKGRGNNAGQLNAKWIRFHYSDFRSQTQLETRAMPIEAEQARQGAQLEETTAVASNALKGAKNAQESADRAQQSADRAQTTADTAKSDAATAQTTAVAAHTKIAAIDDFEAAEALTVGFPPGSARLTRDAKAKLDEFAAKTAGARGFIIEVAGYASEEGGAYYNHELSARRAETVLDYLVGVCNVPVRRVVQYSGGEMNPVADNKTRAGRRQNRRVELKMLVSKGLAAKEQVAAKASQ
jgi:outer membrane protein OmpA-like peptidoglycan-associated protein